MALKLIVRDLSAAYGNIRALRGVNLNVSGGETVVLLGTNGNGKSSLMKCIMGLLRPSAGSIELTIDGSTYDLGSCSTQEAVEYGVAMVPEGRRLFPLLTVEENLLIGAFRKQARPLLRQNLELCYATFPILKDRRRQLAGSMSGGQQQMLAIARALMASPRLLLIDEPSVGLAPILVSQMIEKIGELKKTIGLTVLMAEQNFNQAVRIADRGYIIVHGEIVYEGRSVDDLKNNELVKSYYLGV